MSDATLGWLWFIYYMGVLPTLTFMAGAALSKMAYCKEPKEKWKPGEGWLAILFIVVFATAWPVLAIGIAAWIVVEVMNAVTARKVKV